MNNFDASVEYTFLLFSLLIGLLHEYLVKIRHHASQATGNSKLTDIKIEEELSLIKNILQI